MAQNGRHITLRLEGSRAESGIPLANFESFIDNLLSALRDFDRSRRGAPTRRTGHPERQAEAVTAFRLLRFELGSAVATLEAEEAIDEEERLPLGDLPAALVNLEALVDDVASSVPLPQPVSEALARACRALGSNGSVAIELNSRAGHPPTLIDAGSLESAGSTPSAESAEGARMVTGRLHLIDTEPDKLAIRSSAGIDWVCSYAEQLEEHVKGLVGALVWAHGAGRLLSPLRGRMTIERIDAVDQGEQSPLFTFAPVEESELLARQGIGEPQGLSSFADREWSDDEDGPYLAALLEK